MSKPFNAEDYDLDLLALMIERERMEQVCTLTLAEALDCIEEFDAIELVAALRDGNAEAVGTHILRVLREYVRESITDDDVENAAYDCYCAARDREIDQKVDERRDEREDAAEAADRNPPLPT